MKHTVRHNLARVAVAAATTAGALAAVPSVAQAATYNGVCGSGYGVIDSFPLRGGTAFLTYNGSTGKNCAVTVRTNPGAKIYLLASLRPSTPLNSPWQKDGAEYGTYAGPVYASAPGRCIDWVAQIGDDSLVQFEVHCG
ncbi:spore-associated protein A [Kitasatospora sp. NPDC096147]|uniref:spore-associated protein A n=1 Tax=Kitasatospora sp. NPDC096147 TaxID=3364093 RepID=UPI0037F839DA